MIHARLRGGKSFFVDVAGHAGYDPGHDIVCAGVSALCQAFEMWCINRSDISICRMESRKGRFLLDGRGCADDALLMLYLGLQGIQKSFPENLRVSDTTISKSNA